MQTDFFNRRWATLSQHPEILWGVSNAVRIGLQCGLQNYYPSTAVLWFWESPGEMGTIMGYRKESEVYKSGSGSGACSTPTPHSSALSKLSWLIAWPLHPARVSQIHWIYSAPDTSGKTELNDCSRGLATVSWGLVLIIHDNIIWKRLLTWQLAEWTKLTFPEQSVWVLFR